MILYFLNVWEFYNSNICMSNVWSYWVSYFLYMSTQYECVEKREPGVVTFNTDHAYASQGFTGFKKV